MKGEMCPRLQKKWGRKYWKKEGVMVMDFKSGDFVHDKRSTFEQAEKFRVIESDSNAEHGYTGGKGVYYCISDTGETRNIPMQLTMLWEAFKKIEFKFTIGDAVCSKDTQRGHATKWEVTSITPCCEPNQYGEHDHRYYCKGPSKDYGTCGMYESQMVDWYTHNGKHRPSKPNFAKSDWVCLLIDDNSGFASKLRVDFVHLGDGVSAHKYEVVDVDGVRTTYYQNELILWSERKHKSIPQVHATLTDTTIAQDAQKILELSHQLNTMVMNLEMRLLNESPKLPQFYHLITHETSQLSNLIQEIWNHNKLNIESDSGK